MNPSQIEFAGCTIIAKNYLSMARVLAESWHKFHPDAPFFVLLLDSPEGYFSPENEDFKTILVSELGIPNLPGFLFKYSILEASTAVKPYFLLHLFKSYSINKLLYLDPDIQILNSLDSLSALLDDSNVLLTPHLTSPLPLDHRSPSDRSILLAGTYNLGFIGLRNSEVGRTLLEWWCEKLYHECVVALDRGLFVDQRWINLVPGMFDGVTICRSPGYNIAYWNLYERHLTARDGKFSVNGQPVCFVHFSGFNPDEPQRVSKHQDRFPKTSDLGEARHLFVQYRQLLIEKGWQESKNWKYDHNSFANGVSIPAAARRYYWGLGPDVEHLGDPFTWLDHDPNASAGGGDYRHKLSSLPFGVNVLGYLNSEKGVGEAGRSNLRIVEAAEIPHVANNTVDAGSQNIEALSRSISTANPYLVNLVAVNADQFTGFAESNRPYFSGRYNIGCWVWEMPEFPAEWASAFAHVDEIWTPSQFARDAVATISPVPVRAFPYSIDPLLTSRPTARRGRFGMSADAFVFLFFFDFHSFMERKNPLGLIAAYKNAFGSRTDVQLLIKSSHAAEGSNELRMLQEASAGANIRILDGVLSRDEKHELMLAADCYVSLHRSEGFGLTMAEAMQCGKPVIATGYSGNVDFMTPETSFLVPYQLISLDQDHGPYKVGYHWAQPDLDYAADVMRHVADHRDLAADIGRKAREHVWNVLHPATIAKSVLGRLQELPLEHFEEPL
jgi:glycosyltransferase involved in cell wall biosynthesis